MPVRRRGDGEIVEEATTPQTQRQGDGSQAPPASDAPTEPASAPHEDSLFADAPATAAERWDSATKPIGREDQEGKTRILSPHRPPAASSKDPVAATDAMADPPVGWLVVVRGPGKGNVLTLGNGMNAIGRGTSSGCGWISAMATSLASTTPGSPTNPGSAAGCFPTATERTSPT